MSKTNIFFSRFEGMRGEKKNISHLDLWSRSAKWTLTTVSVFFFFILT